MTRPKVVKVGIGVMGEDLGKKAKRVSSATKNRRQGGKVAGLVSAQLAREKKAVANENLGD